MHNRAGPGSPLELVAAGGARMRFAIFGSGPVSGRGGGNARFLRGVCGELVARGHAVTLYPRHAPADVEAALAGTDVALVHDATAPELVRRIRLHHASSDDYRLLFYDTHQREASAPPELRRFNLAGFDGVLGVGEVITETYLARGWESRAWTWHEAADTHSFAPHPGAARTADLVWIGDRHDLGAGQDLGMLARLRAGSRETAGVLAAPARARLHGLPRKLGENSSDSDYGSAREVGAR